MKDIPTFNLYVGDNSLNMGGLYSLMQKQRPKNTTAKIMQGKPAGGAATPCVSSKAHKCA